jgi:hypothetical protein
VILVLTRRTEPAIVAGRPIPAILETRSLTSAGGLRFPVRLLRSPRPFTGLAFLLRRTAIRLGLPLWPLRFRPAGSFTLVAPHPFGESPPLLVARDLEARPRVAVLSPGTPVLAAPIGSAPPLRRPRFIRRGPQPPAREPHHDRVGMLALELLEGRNEVVAILRTESGWLALDDDCPVGETGRHG